MSINLVASSNSWELRCDHPGCNIRLPFDSYSEAIQYKRLSSNNWSEQRTSGGQFVDYCRMCTTILEANKRRKERIKCKKLP